MTEIVIFHSVLGLRPAVLAFADELRAAGHTAHTPDLWDGALYDSIDDGIVHRDRVGIPALLEKAQESVTDLPAEIVYLGFSLGGALAQALTQGRPGARGAILLHGAIPPEQFGSTWPANVPLQVHAMDQDSWADVPELPGIIEEVSAVAPAALFLYPGTGHLYLDADSPDFDAEASALTRARILEFLGRA
jgi:dienelactone hydrolase